MNLIEITNLEIPELLPFSQLSERQLLHCNEPEPGMFVAESPNVIRRALEAGYCPVSFLIEKTQLSGSAAELLSGYPDVPVYTSDRSVLESITGYSMSRGVLCLMKRKKLAVVPTKRESKPNGCEGAFPDQLDFCRDLHRIAVLEDVMNPTNVGAIFRSAAALGVEAVLLTKGCSDPLYRRAARVSMGTVFQVPWGYLEAENWTEQLHSCGFATVAMALCEDSLAMDDPTLNEIPRLAVVLGTEGDGLKSSTIAHCDYTVRIPMSNGVDSLNVAAASAVAFWQLCRRR
ncbi:MAG: RNA methyltransferase [Lachnospiraceae bacterium]|nr:RNA methyltransferase [Lachnospiraceae bacterium]